MDLEVLWNVTMCREIAKQNESGNQKKKMQK